MEKKKTDFSGGPFLLAAVNSKYIHSCPAVFSLYEALPDNMKEHALIREYTINQDTDKILDAIFRIRPAVIAFSCYIWNIKVIRELTESLQKIMPEVEIWLGGPEVSYEAAKSIREFAAVRGIMRGEGENTFQELMEYYYGTKIQNLSQIRGILYRQADDIFITDEREAADFSSIPFFYENLQDFQQEFDHRILYYESQRGCPYKCSYCLSSIDKTVRFRDWKLVEKELRFFLDRKVKQVKFIDRTFNCNKNHAVRIWKYIKENDNQITNFHFEVAAENFDDEMLEILAGMRPGLVQLELGVQSVNPDTLKAINRYMNLDKLKRVVRSLKKGENIHLHLDLIAGLPYEDYKSFQNSFNEVYAMEPEQLQLGFLKVLKGSIIYGQLKEHGIVYHDNPPYEVLYTKYISYEEIRKLKAVEEMVDLYYNSNQFTQTVPKLIKEFCSAFSFFEELSLYYEEKGYFIQTPARVYRYQVLLDFIRLKIPERVEYFKELLTCDCYLRENMKSRPDFSRDLTKYKDRMKELRKEQGFSLSDSHLEIFRYDERGNMSETRLVLFDYTQKSPLTGDALMTQIPLQNASEWGII